MTSKHGCEASKYSPYQYVAVNIGTTSSGISYTDDCKHLIRINKNDRKPTTSYKQYVHTLPRGNWNSGSYYLGGIHHNGTKQSGFIYTRSCHTDLAVYYWSHDEDNLCPLLIRVRKTWLSWNSDYYYEYYIRDGINKNSWTKLHQDTNVSSGLTKVINNNDFNKVVALKLDASGNTYYANGDSEKALEFNPTVKIKVTKHGGQPNSEFNKYTHSPLSGSMNILCTKHEEKFIGFQKSVLSTLYTEASVYYSSKDGKHQKPLLLQLGTSEEFYKLNGKEWVHDPSLKSAQLADTLKNLSGAHIIKISETTQSTYTCTSPNCQERIKVAPSDDTSYKYKRCKHSVQSSGEFSISSFITDNISQSGIPEIKNITEVNVFHYPQQAGAPLLIIYKLGGSIKCYKRDFPTSNTWREVTDTTKPSSDSDQPGIKKLLLDSHSPSVVINLKKRDTETEPNGELGEYSDPGNSGNKIKVTAENFKVGDKGEKGEQGEEKAEYKKYKHTVIGRTHFRLTSLKHGGSRLDDITSTEILEELVAYYWVGDTAFDKPLVVILKIDRVTEKEYLYYEKSKNSNVSWQRIDREKEIQEIKPEELKKTLDKLKAEYFPPSNIGKIVGGTVGGAIGTGGAGFGGYKLWLALAARL